MTITIERLSAIGLDEQEIGAFNRLAQVVKGDRGRQI